ncbi:MAG: phage portal protein [Burkholderiaceae bacterium]
MRGLFGALVAPGRKEVTLDQLPGFLMGAESRSGVSVTWSSALQVGAMFACARVVGEGLAQSRARLMRPRQGRPGADAASDHPLHRLLFLEPSKGQTAFGLIESIAIHLMFVGNAYVFVNRVGGNRVHELILLEPGRVTVTRRPDMTYSYEVAGDDGATRPMPDGSIWHIRGPSWNGWMGLETIRLAREALGLSLALEGSHAELHGSGSLETGTYSIDGELTNDQHKKLAGWLKKYASGGEYANMPMILDRGAKWFSRRMSGVDSQHLETRRFQIEEICRFARVLPIMVGLTEKTSTYASVEQMLIAHVTHTLSPWAGRIEQSAEVALLTDAEKAEGLFVRFNLNALMRGDFKARQEGLQIMRRNGVINANGWLEIEDMNPRDDAGGDQYIVEANMALQDGRDLPPPKAPAGKEPD